MERNILSKIVVQKKTLGQCCSLEKGKTAIQKAIPGEYPMVVTAPERKSSNTYQFDKPTVCVPLISSRGHGVAAINQIFYQEGKFALGNILCGVTPIDNSEICAKFLSYYLNQKKDTLIVPQMKGGANVSITVDILKKIKIDIPPLPIQQEIVRILDTFTDAQSNLEQELALRKKQYEYYREKLLTFDEKDDSVKWKAIGEIATDCFSGATPSTSKKEYWEGGTIPWMNSGEVHLGQVKEVNGRITELGYNNCSTKMVPINSIVIALAGQGKTRGTVAITRTALCTNQSLCSIVPNNQIIESNYLYYYLKGEYQNLRTISSGDGTRGGLNLKMINSYKIKVPSLSRQQEIVSILDKFESTIQTLEQELALRKKQYEYYREKLLTFN